MGNRPVTGQNGAPLEGLVDNGDGTKTLYVNQTNHGANTTPLEPVPHADAFALGNPLPSGNPVSAHHPVSKPPRGVA